MRWASDDVLMRWAAAVPLLFAVAAFGQQVPDPDKDKDEVAILEIGGAVSAGLTGGGMSYGPNLAAEVTPIENWLELEMGITPLLRRHHSAEWDTDFLFKKPWTISKQLEIMAGIGPEWVHTKEPGTRTNSLAGEAALDFMYWPGGKHRFGMFLEPSYDHNFFRDHEQSFGATVGLLIAIRR